MLDLFEHFTKVNPARKGIAWRTGMRTSVVLKVLSGLVVLFASVSPTWAVGGLTCISDDNHLYFILRGNVSNKGTQVTGVAMTSGTASTCIEAPPGDGILTAFAAGIQGFGASSALLPDRVRTAVLNGKANSSISCSNFDPTANGGTGLLTLPAGGTVGVSGGTIPLVDVHTGDATVPPAVDLLSETRTVTPFVCAGALMTFPQPNPQQAAAAHLRLPSRARQLASKTVRPLRSTIPIRASSATYPVGP